MQQSTYFSKFKPQHLFWLFALTHLIIWTIALTLSRSNAPFDSIEGVAWGNQWQWGYDKHPPLAPWITALTTRLLGAVDWPIYFLGMLSVVVCFWAVWKLASKILPTTQALMSVMLLEGIYYYNIAAAQFNPNVLMLPLWALACLVFYNAIQQNCWRDWLALGLITGLAVLTKYESCLLLLMMFVFLSVTHEGRKYFSDSKLYISLAIFLLVISPNVVWLIHHDFIPFTYTADRITSSKLTHVPNFINHLYHPLLYVAEQLFALVPLFILYAPLFSKTKSNLQIATFDKLFLSIVGLGPAVFVGLLSLLTGIWVHSLWAFPFFSLIGIIVFAMLKPEITPIKIKRLMIVFILFFIISVGLRSLFLIYGPYWQHKTNSAQFPGSVISDTITRAWHERYQQPLDYVAGYRTLVEHISAYSPDKPQPYFEWDKRQSAWIDEEKMRQQGAVFVWFPSESTSLKIPPDIAKRFPKAILQPIMSFAHQTSAKVDAIKVGVAFLPPSKGIKNE